MWKLLRFVIFPVKLSIIIILALIAAPPILLLTCLNELCRIIVSILLKIRYSGKISLVSNGSNNVWHLKKRGNWRTVTLLRIYNEPVKLSYLREQFNHKVLERTEGDGRTKTFASLKKTLVQRFGYFCVRDDSQAFDLTKHIMIYDLSKPSDNMEYFSEEEFFNTIMHNMTQDMDETKPQWEDIIIPRVKFNDRNHLVTVQCFRWHHGYMDGLTVELIHKFCMSDRPLGKELTEPSGRPFPFNPFEPMPISKLKLFLLKLTSLLMIPYLGLTTRLQFSRSRFFTESYSGRRHFGRTTKMDFNLLQKIKNSVGEKHANISSIIVTALWSTFQKMGKKEINTKCIPLTVVGTMRPYAGIGPQNRFTVSPLVLSSQDCKNCHNWREKLTKVGKQMSNLSQETMISFYIPQWFGRFPVTFVNWGMELGGEMQQVTLTSMPVSREDWTMFGTTKITEFGGWSLLYINNGLSIVAIRYSDILRLWLVSDDACLSREEFDFCVSQIGLEIHKMVDDCSAHEGNALEV